MKSVYQIVLLTFVVAVASESLPPVRNYEDSPGTLLPIITTGDHVEVERGQTIEISCRINDSSIVDPYRYQIIWSDEKGNIGEWSPNSRKYKVVVVATEGIPRATLKIPRVNKKYIGIYFCELFEEGIKIGKSNVTVSLASSHLR